MITLAKHEKVQYGWAVAVLRKALQRFRSTSVISIPHARTVEAALNFIEEILEANK